MSKPTLTQEEQDFYEGLRRVAFATPGQLQTLKNQAIDLLLRKREETQKIEAMIKFIESLPQNY